MPEQHDTRSNLAWGFDRGQSAWGDDVNRNFEILAYQGTHIRIIDARNTPPTNPTEADCYLLTAGATGAWLGWDANDLAVYGHSSSGGALAWIRLQPKEGWVAWRKDTSSIISFNGSAWETASLTADQIAQISSVNVPTFAETVTGIEALPEAERLDYNKLQNKPTTITTAQAARVRDAITTLRVGSTLTGDGKTSDLDVASPFTSTDKSKLDGIESGATTDQTGGEIVTKLTNLTGDDRLPYTALRDAPSGTGSRDTGQQIVGKIESLTGNEKLQYSALRDGPPAGAEVNVQANWTEADTTNDAYIQNKPINRLLPDGGNDGDLLAKSADDDYAVEWATPSSQGAITSTEIRDKLQQLTGAARLGYSDIQPATIGDGLTGDGQSATTPIKLTDDYKTLLDSFSDKRTYQADFEETDQDSFSYIWNKPPASTSGGITAIRHDSTLTGDGVNTDLSVASEFTPDEKSKLAAIPRNAAPDQTNVEIRDSLQTLTGNDRLDQSAVKGIRQLPTGGTTGQIVERTTTGYQWVDAGTSAGEQNVQADWDITDTNSDAYIKNKPDFDALETKVNANTTKLAGIEPGATADQTNVEIRDSLQTLTGSARLDASAVKNIPSSTGGLTEEQVEELITEQASTRVDDLIEAVTNLSMKIGSTAGDTINFQR